MHVSKSTIYFDAIDPEYPIYQHHTEDVITCEKTNGCQRKCGAVILLELGTEKILLSGY